MTDFQALEIECKETVQHFEEELKELRTGRAQISMVENILVDSYGAKTPMLHVASLSTPDARSIVIKPWDKSMVPAIEQAIQKSSLGLSPIAESDQIRIVVPSLTEERRKDLVKIMKKKAEESRITLRRNRDEVWKKIQEDERAGALSEDQKFSDKEKMEKIIESYNDSITKLGDQKEKDIMEK